MELLGQGAQRLAHKLEGVYGHGQLAALGAHHSAGDGNPVAHVQVAQIGEALVAQGVDAAEQLDVAARLAQLQKGDLALHALGHDAAGDGDRILGGIAVLQMSVLLVQLAHAVAALDGMAVGVHARGDERLALRLAHLDGIVFDYLNNFFSHISARSSERSE